MPPGLPAPLAADPGSAAPALGTPTALRIAVWPDDTVTLAALSHRGLFLSVMPDVVRADSWQLLATPRAPLSRDLALALVGERVELAWTDEHGVEVRELSRGDPRQPGPLYLDGPSRIAAAAQDGEPRFPLTALATADGGLDLVWTADRSLLHRTTRRAPLPEREPVQLPPVCAEGERLRSLDVVGSTERTAWLVCSTDRGRVLVARWDLAYDLHGSWYPLDVPVGDVVSVAAVCVGPTAMIVAATSSGVLLSAALESAGQGGGTWHSLDPPDARSAGPIQAIAAATGSRNAWLAAVSGRCIWVAPLVEGKGGLCCGTATEIALAD